MTWHVNVVKSGTGRRVLWSPDEQWTIAKLLSQRRANKRLIIATDSLERAETLKKLLIDQGVVAEDRVKVRGPSPCALILPSPTRARRTSERSCSTLET
jgi:hypothetical protein